MLKKTPLFNAHIALNATMTDFAGYSMPIRYKKTSIIDEHLAVRNSVGMFDTSHMGRFWITGDDAKELLNLLVPRDISKLSDGKSAYTFMLNEMGGFKDDIIISQLQNNEFMIVCNAGNKEKIWNWIENFVLIWKNAGKDISLEDKSLISSMIAVQGPDAISLLEKLTNDNLPNKRFRIKYTTINNEQVLFSTTGYTGENGGEIILIKSKEEINSKSIELWNLLLENNVVPCALGSRDTLRLEAGYRLYGNDLSEEMNLLESGLDFTPFVHLNKPSGFIGKSGVLNFKSKLEKITVGFKMNDKGIPRHNYKIFIDNKEVGRVLSGTLSPLTKQAFGLALIPISHKEVGSKFIIEIHGKFKEAEVINLPIYDTNKYGMTRIK